MDSKTIASYVIVGFVGLIVKIIYDWLKNVRGKDVVCVEEVVYTKEADCMSRMNGHIQLRDDVITLKANQQETEKRLDEGQHEFNVLKKDIKDLGGDISGLREDIAGMHPFIKTIADNIELK